MGEVGLLRTFTVEVEPGTGIALQEFLRVVESALLDTERGWVAGRERRLQRIDDPDQATVRVVLATAPTVEPSASESTTTASATCIEMRAPQMRRDSTSRPYWSVPRRCRAEGCSSVRMRSLSVGL